MTVVDCPYSEWICHPTAEAPDFGQLTKREMEVLLLLGGGLPNRTLARLLGISERTVKAHIARIQEKLQLNSRLSAALVSALHHRELCSSEDCHQTTGLVTSGP